MANNETLGASFSIDVTDLKAGLSQANRMIRESESEFKAAAAGMDDWRESEEGLTAKIKSLNSITDLQKKKVNALQSEYDSLIKNGLDPTSKEAVELRTKINSETAALNRNETELKKQKQALEDLGNESEETADAVEETGSALEGLKAAGGVAVSAIAAVGAACVAAVGAFLGLAEATRESRNNMAKLQTAFEAVGGTAEDAEKTFTELYSIMGDEGAAVEAAQQLAQLSANEETLETMTGVLTGVYAKFGNSLPLEGLSEAVNHTAKLGSVQGPLADALEWSGVSVDEFNKRLEECEDEQERAYIIQEQLTDLYWDAGEAYRENNAAIIEANKAQAELNSTMNELGAIAEPIMTTLKQLATELLASITPFVALVGEGLAGALSGAEGAADKLADGLSGVISTLLDKVVAMLPFVIDTIVAVVPKLITALLAQLPTIVATLMNMVVQAINALSAMLPTIVAAVVDVVPQIINSLLAAIPQLLQAAVNLLLAIVKAVPFIMVELSKATVEIVETVMDVLVSSIPILIDAAVELLMAIVDAIPIMLDALIAALPKIIDTIITGVVNAVPQLVQGATKLFEGIITAIPKIIPQLIRALPQIITSIVGGLIKGIPQLIKAGGELLAGLFEGLLNPKTIWNAVKGLFDGIVGGIKELFGIHSPSKVMADVVGKNLALGIGEGFEKNIAGVNKQIAGAMNLDGGVGVVGNIGGRAGGGVVVNQYNNYSQAHSRVELYKTKQATAAAVRLAMAGA